jgi:hypothetical protein
MKLFNSKTIVAAPIASEMTVLASDYPDSFEGRAAAISAALATLAKQDDLGSPFGPYAGLRQAQVWVTELMPDPAEIDELALRSARTLVAGLTSLEIDFEAIDDVLGVSDAASRRYGLTRSQATANTDSAQAAYEVLISLFHGTTTTLHLTADVAQLLTYFQLAVLRLRTAGKLWDRGTIAPTQYPDVWATAR